MKQGKRSLRKVTRDVAPWWNRVGMRPTYAMCLTMWDYFKALLSVEQPYRENIGEVVEEEMR